MKAGGRFNLVGDSHAGVAPARTTDRLDVPAGGTDATDATWFALPLNTNNYLLIDEVRFGQDAGPYYGK